MGEYFHSVRLIANRCKGCVNCIKRCPTEAIRIRSGQAQITEARCIDCGECIRRCTNHAKTAVTDGLADLAAYTYNVALPAPSLYGQFSADISIDTILAGLLKIGFDDVCEVAHGAEMVTAATKRYLEQSTVRRPAISSACPAVVRLVQVKYPELIDNLIPAAAPVEVAAREAREAISKRLTLPPDQVGIWFITPCPAKMTAVKQPLGQEQSNITGAIAMSQIYAPLLKVISTVAAEQERQKSSWVGIGWAIAGGEALALERQNVLVVHEINNVSDMLEQVAMGKLTDVDYIEGLACAGGCIGGPLTIVNRFVAECRLKERIRQKRAESSPVDDPDVDYEAIIGGPRRVEPRSVMRLDDDIYRAMYKVEVMERTLQKLPGLDCGSCGSPNCKALAEDIAQGKASETDCVFKLRERVRDLAREMFDLAEKLPPSLDKDGGE